MLKLTINMQENKIMKTYLQYNMLNLIDIYSSVMRKCELSVCHRRKIYLTVIYSYHFMDFSK